GEAGEQRIDVLPVEGLLEVAHDAHAAPPGTPSVPPTGGDFWYSARHDAHAADGRRHGARGARRARARSLRARSYLPRHLAAAPAARDAGAGADHRARDAD